MWNATKAMWQPGSTETPWGAYRSFGPQIAFREPPVWISGSTVAHNFEKN